MTRRLSLTPEEAELWEKVASTAKPLRPRRSAPPAPAEPDTHPAPAIDGAKRADSRPRPASRPEALFDRRTTRRIARGTIPLDGRIDLHGSNQADAHDRLYRYLAERQAEGARLILVITGKGRLADGERGVLRRTLPHWLAAPRFRPIVAGFDQAHRSHGGAGAYYVRLRRRA